MNFLFLLAFVAFLSIAAVINADMDGPELEQGLQMALDQFVQVSLDKSLGSDDRATQLRALVHPLFVYADSNKDGFISKGEYKAFLEKVIPHVLPLLLAHLPEEARLQAQKQMNDGYPEFLESSFAHQDANGDGQLSLQEVLNAIR